MRRPSSQGWVGRAFQKTDVDFAAGDIEDVFAHDKIGEPDIARLPEFGEPFGKMERGPGVCRDPD